MDETIRTEKILGFVEDYGYLMTEILTARVEFWRDCATRWPNGHLTEPWELDMANEQVTTWTKALEDWVTLTD